MVIERLAHEFGVARHAENRFGRLSSRRRQHEVGPCPDHKHELPDKKNGR